jgi:hypothetical protein
MSDWRLIASKMMTAICLWIITLQPLVAESIREITQFTQPDQATLSRLQSGEIVIENNLSEASDATASVLMFVHGPVENLWSVITSCSQAEVFVDGLELCEVLEDRGSYALTRQVVDKGWASPRIDYTFETFRTAHTRMQFQLTEGNLKTMQGSWEFKTQDDGVLVRHRLVMRPLIPAPRWLVNRVMKKGLPDMLACVRGLAHGSGSSEAKRKDIKRCPNDKIQTGRS